MVKYCYYNYNIIVTIILLLHAMLFFYFRTNKYQNHTVNNLITLYLYYFIIYIGIYNYNRSIVKL